MYAESRKLHLIEKLIKTDNDAALNEIETILFNLKNQSPSKKSFKSFVNAIEADELNELKSNIESGCEQINKDEWN